MRVCSYYNLAGLQIATPLLLSESFLKFLVSYTGSFFYLDQSEYTVRIQAELAPEKTVTIAVVKVNMGSDDK